MANEKLKILKVPPEVHAELVEIAKNEGRILQVLAGQLLKEAIHTRKLQNKTAEVAA